MPVFRKAVCLSLFALSTACSRPPVNARPAIQTNEVSMGEHGETLSKSAMLTSHGVRDGDRSPGEDAISTPQQWKPGSQASIGFEKLQRLRESQPGRFKQLLEAYAASHGDLAHPRLVALRNDLLRWASFGSSEYQQLPAYMKSFSGSGPYRRIITKPGYSYVSGNVFLPCNATQVHPKFETAFAYVGGWGAGKDGKAVDAGFQRSNLFKDYAVFIRAQGFKQISKEPRFTCGPVDFKFYAASDTELVFWARGATDRARNEVIIARLRHPVSYGWPANGGGPTDGIVLKRMTTIGQSTSAGKLPGGTPWNADGSYFGRSQNGTRPLVHWSALAVGQVDSRGNAVNVTPWGPAQTLERAQGGMFNYPDNPFTIWFSCTGCPDETDAIDLSSTRPH